MKIFTSEIWNALNFYHDEGIPFEDYEENHPETAKDWKAEWERICKTMEQLEKLAGINRVKETHNYEEVA